jgi:hypothetical protein
LDFNPTDPHFDRGYAVPSHSSQGFTAECVHLHADTKVHPELLNPRFACVSISRASHEATLFTDDMAKLGPQLGVDSLEAIRSENHSNFIHRPGNWDGTVTMSRIGLDKSG